MRKGKPSSSATTGTFFRTLKHSSYKYQSIAK